MHEAALARQMLAVVLGQAEQAAAERVRAVHGWVAESEALSRESLRLHFAAHARGTRAEGARLELRLVHVAARCHGCGRSYLPEHHVLLCPACGSTAGELVGQVGLGIDALEVE